MKAEEGLLKVIPHVVSEYANLVSSAELLLPGHKPPLQPPINTHVQQDAFLLNCRKMADFFLGPRKKKKDDV